jgi:hypothetical protein
VAEDFVADAGSEHGSADPDTDLLQKAPLVFVPPVGGRVVPQIGRQIEQSLIIGIGRVEHDRMVSQKSAIRIRQPPTPMVCVGELGNFQTECHGKRSPALFL